MELLTIFLLLLNGILYLASIFSRRSRRRGEPPLVRHKLPFVGGTLDFGKAPREYLCNLKKKYGDVFTVLLGGREVHFFSNPTDVKYLEKSRDLKHDLVLYDFATRVVGTPHAIDVGGDHNPRGPEVMHTMAKTMRGSTHLSDLTESCSSTSTYAFEQSIRNHPGYLNHKPIPLYELAGNIIFDITFYMFFGYHESAAERAAERERMYDDFLIYFEDSALLIAEIPACLLPRVRKARNNLLKRMSEIDLKKRVGASALIRSLSELDKEHEEEKTRHLLIILWSAQANSRPALFWIMLHLLKRPNVVSKILKEYELVMKKKMLRNVDRKLTEDNRRNQRKQNLLLSDWLGMDEIMDVERTDLDKMVILDACVKESLRLVGSSMAVRQASKDTTVRVSSGRKYRLRKGDWSAVFSQVTHMDPRIHKNPNEYIYDRYLEDKATEIDIEESSEDAMQCSESDRSDSDGPNHKSVLKAKTRFGDPDYNVSSSRSLLTFGYGTNRCPGRHIALVEIKLCVLLFFRYFDVSLVNPEQELPLFNHRHLGFGVMPPQSDVDVMISQKCAIK